MVSWLILPQMLEQMEKNYSIYVFSQLMSKEPQIKKVFLTDRFFLLLLLIRINKKSYRYLCYFIG